MPAGAVIVAAETYVGVGTQGYLAASITADKERGQRALDGIKRAKLSTPGDPNSGACAEASSVTTTLGLRWIARERHPISSDKHVEFGFGAYDGNGWPLVLKLMASNRVLDQWAFTSVSERSRNRRRCC